MDENILKIDSAFPETVKLINNPPPNYSIEKVISEMQNFTGKLIVQTMFVKGSFNGKKLDNSTEEGILAWIELVKKVMTNNSDDKEYNKTISHFLRDLLAAELEFDNRIDVIDAYKTILKTLL